MNRRVVITATLVVLMLMSFAAIHSPTTATQAVATQSCGPTGNVIGVVIAQGLRVRETPSSTAKQVGLLNPGDVVTVTGRNTTGTWLLIGTPGGTQGWVGSAYVSLVKGKLDQVPVTDESANAAEQATEGAPTIRGAITANVVNIRSTPDTSSDVVAKLIADDVVTVIGRNESGSWLQITTKDNVTGWVGSPYVVLLTGNLTDLPVTDQTANAAATEAPEATMEATMVATMEATVEATMAGTESPCTVSGVTLKGIVVAQTLRVHTKPSSTSPVVGAPIPLNTAVTIEARNGAGTWLKVKTKGGEEGWVGSAYVAVTGGGRLSDLPVLDATDIQ